MTAPVRDQQRTFAYGEISPVLQERDDLDQWRMSLKRCEGYTVMPEGALIRTPGTRYIGDVKDAANPPRLVPFAFNTSIAQSYVLEFGANYCRIWQGAGQVVSGGAPVEIATPYSLAEVWAFDTYKSGDRVYIAHPDHAPRKLERRGHTDWQLVLHAVEDGPYLPVNIKAGEQVTPSGDLGAINVTSPVAVFAAGDVGRHIRLFRGGEWAWGVIVGVASATQVSVDLKRQLPGAGASEKWRLGRWGGANGYPSRVAIIEDRLCFAHPTLVQDYSAVGIFESFAPTSENEDGEVTEEVLATDAVSVAIHGELQDGVSFIHEANGSTQLGTLSAIREIRAGGEDGLTPDNGRQARQNGAGAAAIRPLSPDEGVTLYVGRHRERLMQLAYSLESDRLEPVNLNRMARHICRERVKQIDWQGSPYSLVWLVLDNGELRTCTYSRQERVTAWARQPVAGADAFVHSLCVTPGDEEDEVWFAVSRTINGATRCYIEKLAVFFDPDDERDFDAAWLLQSALRYEGEATNELDGLDHLEGETVEIMADGRIQSPAVVTDGTVTFDDAGSSVLIGLGYVSEFETLGLPPQIIQDTAAATRLTRPVDAAVSYLHSRNIEIGEKGLPLTRINTLSPDDPPNLAEPWRSGVYRVTFQTEDRDRRGAVVVRQSGAEPAIIRAISPTYDSQSKRGA